MIVTFHRLQLALIACLVLAACGTANLPSLEESIAAGYISIETLAESVLAASDAGALSDERRAQARSALQAAKNGLDLAVEMLAAGQDSAASNQVSQAFGYFETVRRLLEDDE